MAIASSIGFGLGVALVGLFKTCISLFSSELNRHGMKSPNGPCEGPRVAPSIGAAFVCNLMDGPIKMHAVHANTTRVLRAEISRVIIRPSYGLNPHFP